MNFNKNLTLLFFISVLFACKRQENFPISKNSQNKVASSFGSQPSDLPEKQVSAFYKAYLKIIPDYSFQKNDSLLPYYVTDRRARAMKWFYQHQSDTIRASADSAYFDSMFAEENMDVDYFTKSQDEGDSWRRMSTAKIWSRGDSAAVRVLVGEGDFKLVVLLARESGVWKIDRVTTDEK